MVVGVMLGVAVVIAIDMANASAARAFTLSTNAITGRATHQITGGPGGLDAAIYTDLRRAGVVGTGADAIRAAPILTEYVTAPALGGEPLRLLGVALAITGVVLIGLPADLLS